MNTALLTPGNEQLGSPLLERTSPRTHRHRTTIYRTAHRLTRQAEASIAGVYWTPAQVADWHPDDLATLGSRLAVAGIVVMRIRGELCFRELKMGTPRRHPVTVDGETIDVCVAPDGESYRAWATYRGREITARAGSESSAVKHWNVIAKHLANDYP